MSYKPSMAENNLANAMLDAHFEKAAYLAFILLCKKDEHANAMAEFIRKYPNEEFDVYLDKAYEILGEPRPEYIIED